MKTLAIILTALTMFLGYTAKSETAIPFSEQPKMGVQTTQPTPDWAQNLVYQGFIKNKFQSVFPEKWRQKLALRQAKRSLDMRYGMGQAIAGLSIAIGIIITTIINYKVGLLLLPLSILGFILSIVGLRKAKWYVRNTWAKRIAIAGVVINSILLLNFLSILVFIFTFKFELSFGH